VPLTLFSECLNDRHIPEFHFSLCVFRKLREPSSDLLFFIDVSGRKWILSTKGQVNLSPELIRGIPSLASISVSGNVISGFVNRGERQKQRRPLFDQGLQPVENLISLLTPIRDPKNVAENGAVNDADAHPE